MSTPVFPFEIWPEGILQARFAANDNSLRNEVLSRSAKSFANAEPASPAENDVHIVGGAWGGFSIGTVVIYKDGTWLGFEPFSGWLKYCEDDDTVYYFYTSWIVFAAGGGGGGGGGDTEVGSLFSGMDSRTTFAAEYGPDEGYDQEFDGAGIADNTLPSPFVWVNQDDAVYRQKFGAGRIDYAGGGDTSNLHAVLRPLPATTTFDAFTHLFGMHNSASSYLAQFSLHNSVNGRFVGLQMYQGTINTQPTFWVIAYTDADTQGATLAGPITLYPAIQGRCYYRITKFSDSNYNFEASPDGGCWFRIGTAINVNSSLGGDPTHIGYALNTPGASHVGCEWLRIRGLT